MGEAVHESARAAAMTDARTNEEQAPTIDTICKQIDAIGVTSMRLIEKLQADRDLLREAMKQVLICAGREDAREIARSALSALEKVDGK
jgi:hypothetical protein